jgi:hypothetical protein
MSGALRGGLRCGALLLVLALAGCGSLGPKAWQRGDLAKPEMAWDPDPVEAAIRSHTYDSKEAATGDASVGGGGCGCN